MSSPPINQLRAISIREALGHITLFCSDAERLTFLPILTCLVNVDD